MQLKTWILPVVLVIGACSDEGSVSPPVEPTLYFPPLTGTTWETTTPASLGWDETALANFYDYMETNNTRALLILKNGRIVVEKYFGKQFDNTTNFSSSSNWYWASAGKTLTSALVGIAAHKGQLSFDEKTSTYLGNGWTSLTPAQESAITVRHQLTMTTGLDDGVSNPDCTTPDCLTFQATPGTRWAYHNAPYTLLDDVLIDATGKNLNTFLTDELKSKIGMDGQYIQTGDNNVYYSTARSMARFGLLLLNKGTWNTTNIIPEDYFTLMTTTSQNLNLSYGYLTWLNGKTSSMVPGLQTVFPLSISSNAPNDLFAAMGKNGQIINIIPSENLIVVRMGDSPDATLVPFTFQNEMWARLQNIIQ